jgi:uncharacterized protein
MKIKVCDIPKDGLELQKRLSPKEIGLEDEVEFKCLTPLMIAARVERRDDVIVAEVRVEGKYELNCARCLEPITKERVDRFELYIDYFPDLEFIDLGENTRQELVMALVEIVICHEDCKGLCKGCGVNLNKEKCKCHKDTKSQGHKEINV